MKITNKININSSKIKKNKVVPENESVPNNPNKRIPIMKVKLRFNKKKGRKSFNRSLSTLERSHDFRYSQKFFSKEMKECAKCSWIALNYFFVFWLVFIHNLQLHSTCFVKKIQDCGKYALQIKFVLTFTKLLSTNVMFLLFFKFISETKTQFQKICIFNIILMLFWGFFLPIDLLFQGYGYFFVLYIEFVILSFCINKIVYKKKIFLLITISVLGVVVMYYLLDVLFRGSENRELVVLVCCKASEMFIFHFIKQLLPENNVEYTNVVIYMINFILIPFETIRLGIFLTMDCTTSKFWLNSLVTIVIESFTRNYLHRTFFYYISLKRIKSLNQPDIKELVINGQRFMVGYYIIISFLFFFLTDWAIFAYITPNNNWIVNESLNWNKRNLHFFWPTILSIILIETLDDICTWIVNKLMIYVLNRKFPAFYMIGLDYYYKIILGFTTLIPIRDALVVTYGNRKF